jgi:WD40 repeat protein
LEAVWERLGIDGADPGPLDLGPEGRYLLFSMGKTVCLGLDEGGDATPLWRFACPARVCHLSFHHQPERLAVLALDETGAGGLLHAADGTPLEVLPIGHGAIVGASVDGSLLTYVTAEGVGQWDLSSGHDLFRGDLGEPVTRVASWGRDRALVVTKRNFGWLDLRRAGSGLQAIRTGGAEITRMPRFLDHLVDRKLLLLGFDNGNLLLLDSASGKAHCQLEHGQGSIVTAFELVPDLCLAVVATSKGFLYFWDLRENRLLERFMAHRGGVRRLRASGNGRYLLSAGDDGMVRLWETSWSVSSSELRGVDSGVAWLRGGNTLDKLSRFLRLGG